ncbi:YncE family protein [Pseudomonas baetica]|uniref:YncE family protein n=1 Tax=Pseudomonas baetica TaxID=674054 RepID=UPI002871F85D|nr:hypothetical protein [Pseudomonas baetica]MDR9864967.1 hypothetical protein [Pseudomonas baetica]
MTNSTPPGNTILALAFPRLGGMTAPVNDAHGGMPKKHTDEVKDGKGAYVFIDPPLTGTLNPGDLLQIWKMGDLAPLDGVTIIDPDAVTILRIPNGRLDHDRLNYLYYTIKRGGGNIGTSTPPLEILYNRIRPGGVHRPGSSAGGHSELELLLDDLIQNGVGPDFVSAQVCVSYPYCRAYDTILFKCNAEIIYIKVTPDQAPPPPNPGSGVPTRICFTIDRAFLDKAKGQDQKLHFSYTVVDQLLNPTDPAATNSPTQVVVEDLDGKSLPMPLLLERLSDYPGDDLRKIDLTLLAGDPLKLVVVTADKRFVVGYIIEATYTAKLDGQPDVVVTVRGTVEADPFGQKKLCILEVANDKVIANSIVTASYTLTTPTGDWVGNSIVANATVTGAAPIQLTPVVLLAPATNPIDPLNNSTGVTVQATYLQALPGDKAQLVIAGAQPFLPVTLNPNKQADFRLDAKFLAERLGSDSRIIWQLIRDDKVIAESPEFILTVSAIKPEDPRFPTPTITAVTHDDTLNLGSFTGGTRMLVAPWRLIAVGQPFWAWCEGTDRNGVTVTEEIHNGVPIGSTSNQGGPVSREFLDKLADGSTIRVYVAVNLDGVVDRATRVLFPVRSYKVVTANTVLTFTNAPYEVVAKGMLGPVDMLLTRDGLPLANATLILTLPPGFQFPSVGGGSRDFTTDAKGMVSVTGIIGSETAGRHELVAKSMGAINAVAVVEVLAEGPVGYIDMGSPQYNIVKATNGLIYVECNNTIEVIDSRLNRIIGSIEKEDIGRLFEMVITPNGEKIYASHFHEGIIVISTISQKIIKKISSFPPGYLSMSEDGSRVATYTQGGSIKIISTSTDTVIKDFLPAPLPHNYLLFNQEGTRLYCATRHPTNYVLAAVDSETGRIVNSKTYLGFTAYTAPFLSSDGTRLYTLVSEYRPPAIGGVIYARVEELSASSFQLMRSFNLTYTSTTPDLYLAAVLPDRLIITNKTTTKATRINLRSGKEEGDLEIGYRGSSKMVYTLDDKRLFACNHHGNLLNVLTTGE